MTRIRPGDLRGAETYARLSYFAVLLCTYSFIEEFRGGARTSSSYVAATRFPGQDEAVFPQQDGRRLRFTVEGHNKSKESPTRKQSSSELQQAKVTESGKADSLVGGALADAGATAKTGSAGAARTDSGMAGVATEKKLTDPTGASSSDSYSLQRLRHQQPGATATVATNKEETVLVSQLPRPEGRLKEEHSEAPRSADAVVSPGSQGHLLTSAESEKPSSEVTLAHTAEGTSGLTGDEVPSATGEHSVPPQHAGAEPAAAAGVTGDPQSGGVESAAPPLLPSSASASPVKGQQAFASRSPPPAAWRPFDPIPTTEADFRAQTSLLTPSHDAGGTAAEAASKWEELSRRHQQMLLSRNFTSVIKLFVDYTQPDHMTPWQMQPPRRCTGSAFVVADRLILTNGHLVDWQTRVLARRHGNARKFNATVVAVAHDCDLALITVESDEFWEGLRPLAFGQVPQLQDTVTVLGYPTGGDQLSLTEGVVSRVGMFKYAHSSHELLTVQIDAAINPGNSGGPALVAGKVVGVAFQGFSDLQSVGYIVPYPVVRHFLNDLALHQRFTGFPTLGIKVTNLENQGMKEYKKLTSVKPSDLPEGITATGVIVIEVDSVRKERYLEGLLRLPYASAVLPRDALIKELLPEDPSEPAAPARPLPHHRPAAPTPETAGSSASLPPSLGVGATVSLPASRAAGRLDAAEAAVASPRPQGDNRSQEQEKHDQQEPGNQQEKRHENKRLTSESDLIVPNVYFASQQALDVEHVGFKIGDVLLAVDGIGACALVHLRKRRKEKGPESSNTEV